MSGKRQPSSKGPQYRLRSVDTALSILGAFELERPELSISEIAHQLDLNKSVVFRALHALAAHGYVTQDTETKRFRLGLGALRIGAVCAAHAGLEPKVNAILDATSKQCGETVTLAVLDGDRALLVARVLSEQDLRQHVRVGAHRPLYCTALGKALLSALSEPERNELMSTMVLTSHTTNTICDLSALAREIDRVRSQGYAWAREEWVQGLNCVAAPLVRGSSAYTMAVSIAVPAARWPSDKEEILQSLAQETAQQLAIVIGHLQMFDENAPIGA